MLESVGWAIPCALILLAKAADQMLGLTGHCVGVLKLSEILHKFLHLNFVDAFVPDRVSAREQEEHHDSGRPHIGFLSISEDVGHLLGRLVQERATFSEVSDRVTRVLHGQPEVEQLDPREVLMTAKNYVIRFYISMNNVFVFMQIFNCSE